MPELFDALNAWLAHHPALLTQLRWLFWFKSLLLFALMGYFLWLVNADKPKSDPPRRNDCCTWKA